MRLLRRLTLVVLAAIAVACAGLPRWSVSANGQLIAIVKGRTIYVVNREGQVVASTRVADKIADPLSAFISGDGRSVIYICWGVSERGRAKKALLLYDLESKETRELSTDTSYYVGDGWSPDGSTFAWIEEQQGERGPLQLFDLKTGKIRKLHPELTGNPMWARDGSALYATEARPDEGKRRGRLVRVGMDGKTVLLGETAGPTWFQVGPRGELWMTTAAVPAGKDADIADSRLWRRAAGAPAFEKVSDLPILWCVLSPDGKHLAAARIDKAQGDGRIKALLLFGADGQIEKVLQEFPVPTDNVEVPALPFWLDATTLMYCWRKNGEVKVYLLDVATGGLADWQKVYDGLK